ncbi:plastocyanin/azurin family copper-binding protein [Nitrosopumilus sp. b1]|uniref:cupredoxin domain-containing protein n=1 Tax=Nitrosopumilus sp. b1 TaxID=2109907 RepID=UPI002102C385|nr:plastocyanin/azurin family copper-binding protein [Nitrosopumilus sp. b1]
MKYYLLAIVTLLFVTPVSVFAQITYDINIPTGAASPSAPFFWQTEKDGSTNGEITIVVGDSVKWKNGDTAAHTVTSGSDSTPDDIFDSGLFPPSKSFTHRFTEIGDYPYFCIVHPWMTGVVHVEIGFKTLPNVGASVGDGMTKADVKYQFNRLVDKAIIDENTKSITFELRGQTQSDDHTLTLILPHKLISGTYSVSVDGQKTSDFAQVTEGNVSTLTINSLKATSQKVTVTGTSVVPEFGAFASMIMVFSLITVIVLVAKRHSVLKF